MCGPVRASTSAGPGASLTVTRYTTSANLLGRQVAVAPSVRRDQPWGDPRRLAFCGADGIQRTGDGGQTWTRVPTDGVAAAADLRRAPAAAV